MIDLTKINDNLFEIKMIDGEIIHLRRPSQQLFTDLIKVGGWLQSENAVEGISAIAETILHMFNNNKEGMKYSIEYVNNLDVGTAYLVVCEYIDHWCEELGE